jgi:hypothetical protein
MALGDLLGGSPKKAKLSTGQLKQRQMTDSLRSDRDALEMNFLRLSDTVRGDRKGLRSDVMGAANADIQQAMAGTPVTNNQALDNAMRKAKGLSRITQARENSLNAAQLRERVGFTQNAAIRKGQAIRAQGVVGAHQAKTAAAIDAGQIARNDARMDLFGTAAGTATGFLTQPGVQAGLKGFFNRPPKASIPLVDTISGFNAANTGSLG